MTNMNTRKAVYTDAAAIARVHNSAWKVAYRGFFPDIILDTLSAKKSTTMWKDRLKNPGDRVVLVSTEDGQITGWITYGPNRDKDYDPCCVWEIYGLYLDPTHWGKGHGRALMENALQEMVSTHIYHITLWVLETNKRARGFYEHMGFDVENRVKKQYERNGISLPLVRYHLQMYV